MSGRGDHGENGGHRPQGTGDDASPLEWNMADPRHGRMVGATDSFPTDRA